MAAVQGTSGFGHVHGSSSEAQVRRTMLHSEVGQLSCVLWLRDRG